MSLPLFRSPKDSNAYWRLISKGILREFKEELIKKLNSLRILSHRFRGLQRSFTVTSLCNPSLNTRKGLLSTWISFTSLSILHLCSQYSYASMITDFVSFSYSYILWFLYLLFSWMLFLLSYFLCIKEFHPLNIGDFSIDNCGWNYLSGFIISFLY